MAEACPWGGEVSTSWAGGMTWSDRRRKPSRLFHSDKGGYGRVLREIIEAFRPMVIVGGHVNGKGS